MEIMIICACLATGLHLALLVVVVGRLDDIRTELRRHNAKPPATWRDVV